MPKLQVPLEHVDQDYVSRVRYALTFVSEDVLSYEVDEAAQAVELDLKPGSNESEVCRRVQQLLQRYEKGEFGFRSDVQFEQKRELPVIDAWAELVNRRWVTQVGLGHVILRGPAAQLMRVIDARVDSDFAREFGAELEIYPSTIKSETLDRCDHFTSFPEHMDFVAHLKQDLDVLKAFSEGCRGRSWSPELHAGRMSANDFAVSPSCCYHCYEGMEGWALAKPGRCVTAVLGCHRYEGANHRSLSRLRAFTMREVVWVGHPAYVIQARARAEDLMIEWAKDWELACTLETANDMFFTDDFAVKASFQRQQEAKRELRVAIPSENQSISIFSSNFHSTTFGKAFGITVGGRPAASGCIGWGYERFIYAIFSQFGFEIEQWPAALRRDFESCAAARV
jgi:seryl-tRNA synthetase